jgi:hypothetical protein
MIILLVLSLVFFGIVLRVLTAPFRYGRRNFLYAYDNPYRYGCRRHHRGLRGLLPIIALVAIDRFFLRRF